jgi:hypothetical protein
MTVTAPERVAHRQGDLSDLLRQLRDEISCRPLHGTSWELIYAPTEISVREEEILYRTVNATAGTAVLVPRTAGDLNRLGFLVPALHSVLNQHPAGRSYRLLCTPVDSPELSVRPGEMLVQSADPDRRCLYVHAIAGSALQSGHVVHATQTTPLTIPPSGPVRASATLLDPIYVKDPSNGFHLMGDRSVRGGLPVPR